MSLDLLLEFSPLAVISSLIDLYSRIDGERLLNVRLLCLSDGFLDKLGETNDALSEMIEEVVGVILKTREEFDNDGLGGIDLDGTTKERELPLRLDLLKNK